MKPELARLAEPLRQAFTGGEFVLHYQPIISLADNRMVGAEALLRWNHPSNGLVAPAAFIPALEATGLIVEVGCWVVREAVRQVEGWHLLYGRHIVDWVSVNLSPRQIAEPEPLLAALRAIDDAGSSLHRLKLETTEPALLRNRDKTTEVLAELERLGIRLAIDDFGDASLSPASLWHAPVDTLKIGADLVGQIGNAEGEAMLRAIVAIARGNEVSIVAEGIETLAQRDFVRKLGCELGQGYLFTEPMDAALLGAHALTHATTGRVRTDPPRTAERPRTRLIGGAA